MKYISNWIESKLNCFKIKQKLALIYCLGMILPLLITDGVIIGGLYYTEQRSVKHEMENVANAVHYSFFNEIDTAATFANSIYTSLYIDDFLHDEYESGFDFYSQYLNFFDDYYHNEKRENTRRKKMIDFNMAPFTGKESGIDRG